MDLLTKLLKSDLSGTRDVYIDRLGERIKVRAITNGEMEGIRERCTFYSGKGKQKKEFDREKAQFMTIALALVEPNVNSSEATAAAGVQEGWEIVKKYFLPGELERLETAVGEASGFLDEEEDDIEEVKN